MKWLSIISDSKLLFNDHVKMITNKAENIVKGLGNMVDCLQCMYMKHHYVCKPCLVGQ